MHLTFTDVWLGYFTDKKSFISSLTSGDKLTIADDGCTNLKLETVLKFSKYFLRILESVHNQGFILKDTCVDFIVYWQKEGGLYRGIESSNKSQP